MSLWSTGLMWVQGSLLLCVSSVPGDSSTNGLTFLSHAQSHDMISEREEAENEKGRLIFFFPANWLMSPESDELVPLHRLAQSMCICVELFYYSGPSIICKLKMLFFFFCHAIGWTLEDGDVEPYTYSCPQQDIVLYQVLMWYYSAQKLKPKAFGEPWP